MEKLFLTVPAYTIELRSGRPIFSEALAAKRWLNHVRSCRLRGDFLLHAFVLLPDRWKAILTPQFPLPLVMHAMEETPLSAGKGKNNQELWEECLLRNTFWDAEELLWAAGELHLEPLRLGLTDDPESYPYSSLSLTDIDPFELVLPPEATAEAACRD